MNAGPIEKKRTLAPRASPRPESAATFYLIGLLITSHHAHSLYEGVARVVHSSLDTLVQGIAIGRRLVAQLGVDGRGEALGHAVVVLSQIRVVCTARGGKRLSVSSA